MLFIFLPSLPPPLFFFLFLLDFLSLKTIVNQLADSHHALPRAYLKKPIFLPFWTLGSLFALLRCLHTVDYFRANSLLAVCIYVLLAKNRLLCVFSISLIKQPLSLSDWIYLQKVVFTLKHFNKVATHLY